VIKFACPKCKAELSAPFVPPCDCGFDLSHLDGTSLSAHQVGKRDKHNSLITGSGLSLHGGEFNASFTHAGNGSLTELLRFTVSFGDIGVVPSAHGGHSNEVRIAYVPEIIGSGVSLYQHGEVACSGVCIISPASFNFGHPYPVLDEWVQRQFSEANSVCKRCKQTATVFGEVFCRDCYDEIGDDWRALL